MKYPCEGCLVDPICNVGCESLYFYMKFIDKKPVLNIPDEVIYTDNRISRALVTASSTDISSDLFIKFVLSSQKN